jgi:undecaprenyl pyrophosphate phosphatase UppP
VVETGIGGVSPLTWVIGFAAAFVCGIVSILFIKTLIKSNRFYIFGIYCLCASAFAFLAGFGVIHF